MGFSCTCSLKPIHWKTCRLNSRYDDEAWDSVVASRTHMEMRNHRWCYRSPSIRVSFPTGWWCNKHLEKYEFVNGKDDIPFHPIYKMENKSHVWNHQPANSWHSNLTATCGEPSLRDCDSCFSDRRQQNTPKPPKERNLCCLIPVFLDQLLIRLESRWYKFHSLR